MIRKPAGNFSNWLNETTIILKESGESDVPCGECNACCNSSYFIHITPNDKAALKHIPKELTFSAPGLPKGHFLLGYDENGKCPMFINNQCSIYQYRPQTCRHYDCRIFTATGIEIEEEGKDRIKDQTKRWQFDTLDENDQLQFSAVQLAAKFIDTNSSVFPAGFLPSNSTQRAIFSIAISHIFLNLESIRSIDVSKYVSLIVESL